MRLVPTSSPTAEAFDLFVFDISLSLHRGLSPNGRDGVLVFSLQDLAIAFERHAARGRIPPDLVFGRLKGRTQCVVAGEAEQRYARQRVLVVVAQPQVVERQVHGPVRVKTG